MKKSSALLAASMERSAVGGVDAHSSKDVRGLMVWQIREPFTFWLYGLVAIGAWIFFISSFLKQRERPLMKLKSSGAKERRRVS